MITSWVISSVMNFGTTASHDTVSSDTKTLLRIDITNKNNELNVFLSTMDPKLKMCCQYKYMKESLRTCFSQTTSTKRGTLGYSLEVCQNFQDVSLPVGYDGNAHWAHWSLEALAVGSNMHSSYGKVSSSYGKVR